MRAENANRMRRCVRAALLLSLLPPSPATAASRAQETRASLCLMLQSAARAHDLPFEFFVRLIWRESRFNAAAVGPATSNGDRAQGIAQFMPRTAAERGLPDPFEPVQALPKAAEYLRDLRRQFGNLGLAAAAYNAGPRRVRDWLGGIGTMPRETRDYVLAITGRTVDDWARIGSDPEPSPPAGCEVVWARLEDGPGPYLEALQQRIRVAVAQPWGVQLAGGFSRDAALNAYARSIRMLPAMLVPSDPIITGTLLRNRGTRPFYQVKIGAASRSEADGLCTRIRRAGGACVVTRNAHAQ